MALQSIVSVRQKSAISANWSQISNKIYVVTLCELIDVEDKTDGVGILLLPAASSNIFSEQRETTISSGKENKNEASNYPIATDKKLQQLTKNFATTVETTIVADLQYYIKQRLTQHDITKHTRKQSLC